MKPLPLRPRRGSCYPDEYNCADSDEVTASDSESWRAVAEAFGSAPFDAVRPIGRYWETLTSWYSYRPASPRYRKRLGPAHQLQIHLGWTSPTESWMAVETTARGEYDRRLADGHYTQVLTHDHPPEHKARAKLGDAVQLSVDFSRLLVAAERDRWRAECRENERRAKAVPTETVSVPVDGESVAFTIVRFDGFIGASAALPERTITAWGRFDDHDLRLRSVSEIPPYLSDAGDSPAT